MCYIALVRVPWLERSEAPFRRSRDLINHRRWSNFKFRGCVPGAYDLVKAGFRPPGVDSCSKRADRSESRSRGHSRDAIAQCYARNSVPGVGTTTRVDLGPVAPSCRQVDLLEARLFLGRWPSQQDCGTSMGSPIWVSPGAKSPVIRR